MAPGPDESDAPDERFGEAVRTDRSGLITLLGHFYRGQLDRETTWRNRLDRTTDWSVIVIATLLTWAFTSTENPHYVLLIGMLLVVVFLLIDVRRYQAYDVWRSRIELLEGDLFAQVFDPEPDVEHHEWPTLMSEDLRRPVVKVGVREAVTKRLRRIYLPLVTILVLGWLFHITIFQPHEPWLESAAVVGAPGPAVVVSVGVFYVAGLLLALWPVRQAVSHEFHGEEPGAWDVDEEE